MGAPYNSSDKRTCGLQRQGKNTSLLSQVHWAKFHACIINWCVMAEQCTSWDQSPGGVMTLVPL